jgi:hypothetical protein
VSIVRSSSRMMVKEGRRGPVRKRRSGENIGISYKWEVRQ